MPESYIGTFGRNCNISVNIITQFCSLDPSLHLDAHKSVLDLKGCTVKLGYNELGYNELGC
jgi:hypothetical protein